MVKKLKQKKKKIIVDPELENSLQASGFSGEIKNRAYMAPIQREILEYKKIKKKRKKARKKAQKKLEIKPEIVEVPKVEKKESKINLISRFKSLFASKPKQITEEKSLEPIQIIAPINNQQIQQPLSPTQVIKEIKEQEIPAKKPKENIFPDIQKLDHHKDEIEIIEHEPPKKEKKESLFSKVKSLFKSENKEDDLYTLEPITATSTKEKLKDLTDASATHIENKEKNENKEIKENKTEEVSEDSSSIGMLFNEKKKKTT